MKQVEIAADVVEQFGNMIALRKRKEQDFPGIAQLFVASVIQCQPLAEVEFLFPSGQAVELKEVKATHTPVSHTRVYESEQFLVHEEIVVHRDCAAVQLTATLKEDMQDDMDLKLRVSGGFLMSPQGVPYHWDEEKNIAGHFTPQRLTITWRDLLALNLSFSHSFDRWGINSLREDDPSKSLYFHTFNAKKRYTYWIDREKRLLGDNSNEAVGRNLGYYGEKSLTLEKGKPFTFVAFFALDPNMETSFSELKEARKAIWDDFLTKIPQFSSEHDDLVDAYYKSWFVLFSNQMHSADPRFKYQFTSVNKFHYYNQFFWDSGFHAIPWIWYDDPVPAESELKNFVLNQWRIGMLPYELFLYDINGREWMETDALTTAATQPPVLAISLLEIYRKFGNEEFLEFFYEPLLLYEEWLWKYRDLEGRGLSYVYHIWESGTDNSPRFDSVHRNRLLDPPLEEVDFNVFIYLLRQTLIDMAKTLGKEPPRYLQERMELAKRSANELMLDKKDGFYYDVWAGDTQKINVKTFAGLLPLITDWPDDEVRARLISDYLLSEDEFNSACPVPSVSMSEPTFDSGDFWRGANWPQITWTFIYGLKEQHPEEAAMILDKYLATSTKKHFCNEYCNSVTGEDVGLPFQGWGTLYVDLILRHLFGIEPMVDGFRFSPLKTRYESLEVRDVKVGDLTLKITRNSSTWDLEIKDYVRLIVEDGTVFEVIHKDGVLDIYPTAPIEHTVLQPSKGNLICVHQ